MICFLLRLGRRASTRQRSPDEPDLLSTGEADLSSGPFLDHGTEQQQWTGDQRGGRRVSQHDSVQKGKAASFSLHVCVCV